MSIKMNFEIEWKEQARVMEEKVEGQFTSEYYINEYHQAYVHKKSIIGNKPWAKIIDMKQYLPSTIVDTITIHKEWLLANNCTHVACVVPDVSPVAKMQMERASRDCGIEMCITKSFDEAKKFLNDNGFKY